MKRFFALTAILALVFAACEQPVNVDNSGGRLPSLTIRNESSFVLTDVKFSGISFASSGNDLPTSTQSVKQLTANDVKEAGYITFIRKDIGIVCRIVEAYHITQDRTITILDISQVEEVGNSGNKASLSQISFLSKVVVERGGLNVPKNDIVDMENELVNLTKQIEFTLKNTGVGKLLLTGTQPVKITGTGADAFSVVQPSSSEIAPNGSLTFKINFSPGAAQDYNATVTINSNDRDGDFTFTIRAQGVAPKPIASVFYGNTEISPYDTINAGEIFITQSKTITVIIKNTGMAELTIDTASITITGTDEAAFTKTTNPDSSILIGGQALFDILCKPVKEGENRATLTIPTNDSSRNPLVVYLQTTAVKGSVVLELSQGSTVIVNNSLTPFDFGQVELGNNKPLPFTIKNKGNIALELTGTPAVESPNAAFVIQTQPANKTISPNAEVSFLLQYAPSAEAEQNASITIYNNSDDMVFTLNVKGTGYEKKPQIIVQQGVSTINPHGEYNFDTVAAGKSSDITFTIRNSGDANLTFTTVDGNRINLADNASGFFSVTQQPSASAVVTPTATTTFVIRFSPTTVGNNFTATVRIVTNSRNNDEFAFTVKGTARAANSEARLSGMQFTKGKLDQQFNSNIFNYTLKIDAGLTLVNVIPASIDPGISDLKVNGVSQNSGIQSQDIILASTGTVTIVVTAEDGITTSTYTVTINRIVNYSNAALSSMYVSNMDGTDTEDVINFLDGNNTVYWSALPDETQLKFRATPVNSNATVRLNNSTIINGVYTGGYTLNSGSAVTNFTFTVTSEDGENTRTFTVQSSFLGSQWERVGNFPSGSNGLALYPYEHTVIVHNNQFVMTNGWEVWISAAGTTWNRVYVFPDDIDHYRCSTVLFNNTIYNIGGERETTPGNWQTAPLVSYSTNGTIWSMPSVTGLTNGIQQHTSVVFNSAIYTLGGWTSTLDQTNAVWSSINGTTWTQLAAPAWGARSGHASVVYDNKIFVIGGMYNSGNSEYRDVWSSTNGTTWVQVTNSAAWTGRNDHTVNANSKGMWLVGGNDGFFKKDVWFSRDGGTWTNVLQNAPFAERATHAAAIKDGYLYIFGGLNRDWDDPNYLIDIWRTYIGD